jgi:dihydropteroate synthase
MRPVGVRVRTGAVSVSDRRSRLRDAVLELAARRTLLMGIVNLTPDSFSDGGRIEGPEAALQAALDLTREGADIIDLGGESTRPGAPPVSEDEELVRVLEPVRLICESLDHPVSIDTYKAAVARKAAALGAVIINDIWGATRDQDMIFAAAETRSAICITYNRGVPDPALSVLDDMRAFFDAALARSLAAGVPREHVILDPGLGFGKTYEQNYLLMARLDVLLDYRLPVLVGASRKSFVGRRLDRPVAQRLAGSLACGLLSAMNGASILRVHDVAAHRDALDIAQAFREAG